MKKRVLKLLLMGLTYSICGLIMQILFINVLAATDINAQNIKSVRDVKISIGFNNEKLRQLFDKLEAETPYVFVYDNKDSFLEQRFSLTKQTLSLEDLLLKIAQENKVKFKQINNNISVSSTSDLGSKVEVSIREMSISGTVTSASDGLPIPGATVILKGTAVGTVTNLDGEFSLEVPENGAVLVVSFIGYLNQEVPVSNQSSLTIVMQEDLKSLDEVVVVGYGVVKKEDLTGSVAQVEMKEVEDIPANSVERVLQGRAAGLQIINPSQDPGAGSTVRIRGGSSLRGSNSPLVVVDGFPLGDAGELKQINPADIESVEVLKDASASAIYGSRGANGVIMITTKKAKKGQTTFSLRQQLTLSEFTSKLNLWREPALMSQLNNESRVNGGFEPVFIGEVSPSGIYYPSVEELSNGEWPYNTRWDEIVFREAPISNNTTLSIASSNEKTSFNISAAYFTDKGIQVKDDYSKVNTNFSVSHRVLDNLKITFSNILTRGNRNANGGLAYWRSPVWPVYSETGDYYLLNNIDFEHPVAISDNRKNESKTLDLLSFLDVEWEVIPSLTINSRLNFKYGNSINDVYQPRRYTEAGEFNNGAAYINNWQGTTLVSETFANYRKVFGKHDIGVTLGYSYQSDESRSSNLGAFDFVNETLNNENLGAGNLELNRVGNGLVASELVSGIFRFNYTFDEKYLITFTSRSDGSSKFGNNNKWAFFPSGALSWKAHEEGFIKQMNLFDQLKFRVSYGISGNQGISPYQTLSRYGVSNYFSNGNWVTAIGPGIEVGRTGQSGIEVLWGGIPNPDLKWETTGQFDAGVDFSLFGNKLNVTFDYYQKNTNDLLQERILPLSSGYDRMWINNGAITNRGIELTVGSDLVQTEDFSLNATLIYFQNRNEVTSLGNPLESGLMTDPNNGMQFQYSGNSIEQFRGFPNLLAVGQPVNVFYGYKTDGIVQTLEEGVQAGLEGDLAQPGEFKYVDINGDGTVDEKDRTIIGDPNPDFLASLNLALTYKKFDVSIFVNGVFGIDVLNTQAFNQPSITPFRWTPDNPTNDYPSLKDGRQIKFSDWWIEDGSFVRIQNLNMGYNFDLPKSMRLRLSMNAANVFTFSKFNGYDPEVGTDGRYWGGYPRLRQWTAGLNLTF
ncbi:TonB-dependent receptor [Algoriphagus sp. NG3]|uniref:SusC/RagA family TonB-linked outer membrane protein n=1 Tax=Algoriphagus sp. NG3 TaxID=3097546 RepID=UPI002A83C539|nr:TonB-dependent receptor [Algoriphagus sp. NG3]WPR77676.1 TonB-dependent receptor [Algoriphagus sp. NG3]